MSTLYELLIEPWHIGTWMWRGVLVASLVSVSCALIGCFLYLRRLSLLSDAIAHAALPGIVAAYLLTGEHSSMTMMLGAIIAGLVTSGLVTLITSHKGAKTDAAIGIVFTSMFALGTIMLTGWATDAHIDLDCVLFGDILGVADHSIAILMILSVIVIALVIVFFRPLQISSFDPAFAAAVGLPVGLIHGTLMGALSVTTVASFEAVGTVLVIAAIITPAATAHLLTRRLHHMVFLAVAHGLLSALLGMYVSIWLNCSSGGAMVSVSTLLYALAFVWTQIKRRLPGALIETSRTTNPVSNPS